MIDGIRRKFGKSTESDLWTTDQELKPEAEEESELPTDTAVLLAATQTAPGFSPRDGNLFDYYKGIVKTAIDNGGKYGDHQIPVPWLRMILAGLEYKYIDPETMWYEVDAGAATSPEAVPPYEDLFPTGRDLSTTLR